MFCTVILFSVGPVSIFSVGACNDQQTHISGVEAQQLYNVVNISNSPDINYNEVGAPSVRPLCHACRKVPVATLYFFSVVGISRQLSMPL